MCPPPGEAIVDLPILTTTTEPMMRTRQPTTTLEDQPIPVRAKLAAAWTSVMFLYVYVGRIQRIIATVDQIVRRPEPRLVSAKTAACVVGR